MTPINDDIDLASAEFELEETLTNKPLPKKRKVVAMSPESEQEDEDASLLVTSVVGVAVVDGNELNISAQ